MYICICKAVTDAQIREAIHQGACTRRQLIECLSVGRACGKCNGDVRALLQTHAPDLGYAQPLPLYSPCNPAAAA